MIRVVTGYDKNGNPAIVRQGAPPTVIHAGRYTTTEFWVTDPADPLTPDADPAARQWELEPPPGGTCFRMVEIAPGAGQSSVISDTEHERFQAAHSTETLDYVTILTGEVTLVVGDAVAILRPGDSVVQQPGVPHDWQNRTAEPSMMAGVLVSAKPASTP